MTLDTFPAARSAVAVPEPTLERRGRWWVFGSFVLCPCHLPLTLAVLTAVLGGTAVGGAVADHTWLAGTIVSVLWLGGTGYGFWLLRRARRGGAACPAPRR
ncbi:MAG: hypothetical protein MUF83_15965 [Acidimicrobiales bacterium]|nr:hypothetical protein [Acidimicrobiales bacterium]